MKYKMKTLVIENTTLSTSIETFQNIAIGSLERQSLVLLTPYWLTVSLLQLNAYKMSKPRPNYKELNCWLVESMQMDPVILPDRVYSMQASAGDVALYSWFKTRLSWAQLTQFEV